ncbi:hypothetical protein Pfo_017867 [Paulownia fortunei]|nr:hypothetical protein Pfo_017867 [Paulownia fortunei]
MAKAKTTTAYLLITATIFLVAVPRIEAQSPAPASTAAAAPGPTAMAPSPGPDCFTALANLADCLSFVEDGSNLTKPDPACCPEVANLVDTQPICLCELLSNSTQFGFSIDTNRALKLPSLCNVTTPSVSLCAAVGVPVAFSAPSPSAVAATPSGNDDNASPSNLLPPNQHFFIGLALVLFTSFL